MKMVKNLAALASLLVVCLFAACNKGPDDDPRNGEELITLKLTFEAGEVTDEAATFTVTPSDNEISYYWDVMPEDSYRLFSGVEELKSADMEKFMRLALNNNLSVDEVIAQSLSNGVDTKTFEGLTAKTDYIIYGYAIDTRAKDELSYDDFETGDRVLPAARLELVINDTRMSEMDVTVTPENRDIYYYMNYITDETYQEYGGNLTGLIEIIEENLQVRADEEGVTLDEFIDGTKKRGLTERTYTRLLPGSTYWVFAVEFDDSNNMIGIKYEPATTDELELLDITFDIDIKNVNQSNAEYTITPSDPNVEYFWDLHPVSDYEKVGRNDYLFMNAVIESWGDAFDDMLVSGVQTGDFRYQLPTGTDFMIVAFATNGQIYLSELTKEEFRTGDATPAADVTFDVDVTYNGQQRIVMSVTPSDNLHAYHFRPALKSKYAHLATERERVQAAFDDYIDNWLDWYHTNYPDEGYTRERVIQGTLLNSGPHSGLTEVRIEPDSDYFLWAGIFSIDTGTLISTTPAYKEFRTQPFNVGTATINIEFGKYFYAESILGPLWEAQPSIGVILDIDVTGAREPMVTREDGTKYEQIASMFTFFSGNEMMNPTEWPDHRIVSELYVQNNGRDGKVNLGNNPARNYLELMMLRRNASGTLVAVAVDPDDNYGPVFRKAYSFPQSGESPASEFPEGIFDDLKTWE